MRFADLLPSRWRTPGPHPATPPRFDWFQPPHYRPASKQASRFYRRLHPQPLEAALLFVAEHPGWRLRYLQGDWRIIRTVT